MLNVARRPWERPPHGRGAAHAPHPAPPRTLSHAHSPYPAAPARPIPRRRAHSPYPTAPARAHSTPPTPCAHSAAPARPIPHRIAAPASPRPCTPSHARAPRPAPPLRPHHAPPWRRSFILRVPCDRCLFLQSPLAPLPAPVSRSSDRWTCSLRTVSPGSGNRQAERTRRPAKYTRSRRLPDR